MLQLCGTVLTTLSVVLLADYAALGSIGPVITFSGPWGPAFAGLDHLQEIHLSSHVSNISSWPAALTTLPNLRVLHLAGPGAPGDMLPAEWSLLTSLQSLWLLNMTHVQGELPTGASSVCGGLCFIGKDFKLQTNHVQLGRAPWLQSRVFWRKCRGHWLEPDQHGRFCT
jgi:hypothetical protein